LQTGDFLLFASLSMLESSKGTKKLTARRVKILQLLPECHDRSHDPTDLGEQIVAAFPRSKYEVTSAFLAGKPSVEHPPSQAEKTHYFNFPESAQKGLRIRLKYELFKFCKKNAFDVVICHRFKPVSYILELNRIVGFKRCIGISHGFGEYRRCSRRLLARLMINDAWRFVGVSDSVRDYLVGLNCGFTPANTRAIPNAIDIDGLTAAQHSRAEARRLLGLSPDALLIGAIGRLVPVKGHIYLIRGFAQIADQFPGVQMAIIGEGREKETLLNEVQRFGLDGRVHLLGWKNRAMQYARAFDVWAMPSLMEGFGLALLEGMSAAIPVLASDIPAMRPMILGAGGLAVPPKDSAALANGLATLLSLSDDERKTKGRAAYEYLSSHHRVEDYKKAYLALVEDSLGTGGAVA
jgi:glycosyltransferase involved in cell wall biosynthesis